MMAPAGGCGDVGKMLPPSLTMSRHGRIVLEEDTFTSALAAIIQRDFFPHIPKLKAQREYLDALEQNDLQRMHDISARYARQHTQAPTPAMAGSATPFKRIATPNPTATPRAGPVADDQCAHGRARHGGHSHTLQSSRPSSPSSVRPSDLPVPGVNTNLPLDVFLNTYTSEDNASFEDLQDRLNRQHRERFPWLYDQSSSCASSLLWPFFLFSALIRCREAVIALRLLSRVFSSMRC